MLTRGQMRGNHNYSSSFWTAQFSYSVLVSTILIQTRKGSESGAVKRMKRRYEFRSCYHSLNQLFWRISFPRLSPIPWRRLCPLVRPVNSGLETTFQVQELRQTRQPRRECFSLPKREKRAASNNSFSRKKGCVSWLTNTRRVVLDEQKLWWFIELLRPLDGGHICFSKSCRPARIYSTLSYYKCHCAQQCTKWTEWKYRQLHTDSQYWW